MPNNFNKNLNLGPISCEIDSKYTLFYSVFIEPD